MIKIMAINFNQDGTVGAPSVFVRNYKSPKTAAQALKRRYPGQLKYMLCAPEGVKLSDIMYWGYPKKHNLVFRIYRDNVDGDLIKFTDYVIYEEHGGIL